MGKLICVDGLTIVFYEKTSAQAPDVNAQFTILTPVSTVMKCESKGVYAGDVNVMVTAGTVVEGTISAQATFVLKGTAVTKTAGAKCLLEGTESEPVKVSWSTSSSSGMADVVCAVTKAGQTTVLANEE